jgi:hypothetical protein
VRFDLNPPSIQKVRAIIRINNRSEEVFFTLISLPLYLIEKTHDYLRKIVPQLEM